jgi:hypothetical protein
MPPGGIRTRSPSKRTAAEPRIRPRGHWDRQSLDIRGNMLSTEYRVTFEPSIIEYRISYLTKYLIK